MIGIIGAMEVEVESLKSAMTVKRTFSKASMDFFEGTIGDTEVVVVRSGICKVNAGISYYQPMLPTMMLTPQYLDTRRARFLRWEFCPLKPIKS